MADGFAINAVGDGGILVDTVHTSRRGAIVNWLVTRKDIMVTADRDDEWIKFMWQHLRGERDYCIKIEIHAVQGSDANVTARPLPRSNGEA